MALFSAEDFWSFIAPNRDDFIAKVAPALPQTYLLPGQVGPVDNKVFAALAYGAPWSAAGILARVYYEGASTLGLTPGQRDVLANALNQQGAAVSTKGDWQVGEAGMVLVIPNIYRVAIKMVAGGKNVTNVLGLRGSTSGQQVAAANAALAAWKVATGPMTALSSLVAMVDVTAVDLSSSAGGIAVVVDATAGSVGSTNSLSTRAAAALIGWNAGTRSRSARGRLYLGPLMEQDIQADGASLQPAAVTKFNTAMTAMRNSLSTAGFPLVVISSKNASTVDVTSHATQTTIATQRRRLRS